MPDPIRIAIIGYGGAGRIIHAPMVKACGDFTLAAIASSRPDAVHADWPDVPVLPDLDAVLKDGSIEAVILATPNELHGAQALAALAAGKHVIIDKPFATSLAEAQAIADAAQAAGRLVVAFQNRRWDGHILTARSLLAAGRFGTVSDVILRYDRLRAIVPGRWSDEDRPGSGLWFNLGSHLCDQAIHLFGAPKTVWADFQAHRPGARTVDYFNVVLGYDGFRVILHSCVISPAPGPLIEIQGSHGAFVKFGEDTQEDMLKARRTPGDAGWGVDPVLGTFTPAEGETRLPVEAVACGPGNYMAFYQGFAAAVRGQGPSPVPVEESLLLMRVMDLAIDSAREGRRLEVTAW